MRLLVGAGFWFIGMASIAVAQSTPSGLSTAESVMTQKVAALLQSRCAGCHSESKKEGGYVLTRAGAMFEPGDSGRMPIHTEQLEQSELLKRIRSQDDDQRMPPDALAMSPNEVELIEEWLRAKVPGRLPEETSWAAWALADGTPGESPHHYPKNYPVSSVVLGEDGQSVYVAGRHEVLQWQSDGQRLIQRKSGFGRSIVAMSMRRDGRQLAVSSGMPGRFGVIQLWNLDSEGELVWLDRTSDMAQSIEYSPGQDWIAAGMLDGSLEVRSTEDLTMVYSATPHADAILSLTWSSDGKTLMTSSRDRTARTFDVAAKKLITAYDRHERAVGGVAFLNENPMSVDETGKLKMWPKETGEWSMGDRDGLDRRLHRIMVHDQIVLAPSRDRIRRFKLEWREVDDGKDDQGKPKKKNKAFLDELPSYLAGNDTGPGELLLCMDVNARGDIVAGSQSGKIFFWRKGGRSKKMLESGIELIQKALQPSATESDPNAPVPATAQWFGFPVKLPDPILGP